jgi:hypothetical protein
MFFLVPAALSEVSSASAISSSSIHHSSPVENRSKEILVKNGFWKT